MRLLLLSLLLAGAARCPVDGKDFGDDSRVSFEASKDGKTIRFCSFDCARKFHRKSPMTPLRARDWVTGAALDARTAWFSVGNEVFAFAAEDAARQKGGTVVKGFEAAEHLK